MMIVVNGLYLLFSAGVVKATHFCMGREASVRFFTGEPSRCACSSFTSEDGCCDDEHDLLKVEDSQKHISQFQLNLPVLSLLGEVHSLMASDSNHADRVVEFRHEPRLPVPLYQVYCTYVLYDHDDDSSRA